MKKKIVFGLENILIGNIKYLLSYKKLIQIINENCKHKKIDGNICNIDKDIWKKNISEYFFRPFIKEFFKKYKSSYDFYIFTKLEKEFSYEIIELIEEYANISFKRPIYTQENLLINYLNNYQKDISFFSSFLIIDDKINWSEKSIILTPELYNYTFIPHIESNLLYLIRNIEIKTLFNFNILPLNLSNNYDEFYFNYYLYTAQLYKKFQYENQEFIKDEFFKNINLINK